MPYAQKAQNMRKGADVKALSFAIKSVTNSAATNVAVPAGATQVHITSQDYGCHYKWKTAADTDDCENSDAGKCLDFVLPGGEVDENIPAGATYISLKGGRGQAYVTVSFR